MSALTPEQRAAWRRHADEDGYVSLGVYELHALLDALDAAEGYARMHQASEAGRKHEARRADKAELDRLRDSEQFARDWHESKEMRDALLDAVKQAQAERDYYRERAHAYAKAADDKRARAERAEAALARVEALAEKWVAWDEGDEFSETRNWDGRVLGSVLRAALNGAEA